MKQASGLGFFCVDSFEHKKQMNSNDDRAPKKCQPRQRFIGLAKKTTEWQRTTKQQQQPHQQEDNNIKEQQPTHIWQEKERQWPKEKSKKRDWERIK